MDREVKWWNQLQENLTNVNFIGSWIANTKEWFQLQFYHWPCHWHNFNSLIVLDKWLKHYNSILNHFIIFLVKFNFYFSPHPKQIFSKLNNIVLTSWSLLASLKTDNALVYSIGWNILKAELPGIANKMKYNPVALSPKSLSALTYPLPFPPNLWLISMWWNSRAISDLNL